MKALVTGSRGFVGKYLCQELKENGYSVIGVARHPDENAIQADLNKTDDALRIVRDVRPDIIIHLAGQANVGLSWKIPQDTFETNVICTINLLEAVRQVDPAIRVVLVGSSDQYGNLGAAGELVSEELPLNPQTPYAVSKKAQEEIAMVYVRAYGMNLCMTRSFNHGGAGQKEGFLIPDFSAGIVRVEKGLADKLTIGNLTAKRDFTHVKDVVRAYRLLAEKGHPGEVYNVGSGVVHSVQEVLDELRAMAKCDIPVEQDPAKMRPSDTPVICCDHTKLTQHTGWEPQHTLQEMLSDALEDWRNRI